MPGCSGSAVMTNPSGGLCAVAAEGVDLGAQRRQPVGLMAAQVSDPGQPGNRPRCCQRRQRRHRRRQLPDVVKVDVKARVAAVRLGSADFQKRIRLLHSRSEQSHDVEDGIGGLHADARPAGDAHHAAGDHGSGEERHRVGQVRFDIPVPGGDRPRLHEPPVGGGVVDPTPASRSMATVIAMCGAEGIDAPVCTTVRPSVKAAPDSSRPDTNCDDADASISTCRPAPIRGRAPPNGSAVPSTSTPRPRSASSRGAIGRARACSSPSNVTTAVLSAASGGTNRRTVPARPQSMRGPRVRGRCAPLTVRSVPVPSTSSPRARSAPIIRSVSRLRSAPLIVEVPRPWAAASAASTRARLVWDFEPGTVTVACTGVGMHGAVQVLTAPILPCRARLPPWRHVRTIRGHHRPGPAGREDPRHRRSDRRGRTGPTTTSPRRPPSPRWSAATTNPRTPRAGACG